jgi:tetratricopeptide (TPR) repeat protein
MVDGIKKYNPAFLSKDALVKSFVVRGKELGLIVQTIRHNTTESNQHILVMGPRGIGKTMLVLRVAEEIRRDKELSEKWYPLVFAEESYSVSTPGEFWLEAIFHLAHQTKENKWNETYDELSAEKNEEQLRERALAQLMDFADSQGKRILLIVENLNMLLGDQISSEDAWVLRKTLLSESRIMLLATATDQFRWERKGKLNDEIENLEKAFFELFQQYKLLPLNESECRILWTSITGKDSSDERIRPLQILTGGNLRLLTIISTFASQMSLRELMKDLLNLVDENTEYFKSHLDSLPPVERKVYLALAELWDPSSSREVAKLARLEVSKTSALLLRLIERGAVVEVKGTGRSKLYQVAERMYNIYYLMRRPGAPSMRVRALVKFMTHFYEPEDLVKTASRIAEEACGLEPELRGDHYLAYEAIIENATDKKLRKKIIETSPKNFFGMPDVPTSLKLLIESQNKKQAKSANGDKKVQALLEKVIALIQQPDKLNEAETLCRKTIDIATQKAIPWGLLGCVLEELERYDEAESAYRRAIELEPKYVWACAALGQLLHQKLGRYHEAESAYHKAVELDPKYAWAWAALGQLLHEELRRYDAAEKAYRQAVKVDPKYAWAWEGLGQLLHEELGRYDEAEKIYRKVIELDSKDAWVWVALGRLLLEKLGRYDEAESAFRKAIVLKPNCAPYEYILAFILCASGKESEALEHAGKYLEDVKTVEKTVNCGIELFVKLAARGFARESIKILQDSPSAKVLEPLVVGLRLFIGEDVQVATEIVEIGKDVAERIRKRQKEIESKM